ncbi:MAG: hypothetical protein HY664_07475, partial [Chloroflexi bacterium]|nr:hypothetical protein [Chloroflexota bacterium]
RVVESLRGVGNKKDIGALLRNSCAPLALEDDTVVLGFYWAFHKDMIEEVENRLLVEEALTKVLGAPHRVRCVLTPRNTRKPSPLMKAAIDMGAKVVNTQRGEKDE